MKSPETIGSNNSPDKDRYKAAVTKIAAAQHVTAIDVHSLLEVRESVLSITPEQCQLDRSLVGIALDRWETGNRTHALEYTIREAFDCTKGTMHNYDKLPNYESFKLQAGFWLKCAEAILSEPLCKAPEIFASALLRADKQKSVDPELYTFMTAAISWNAAWTSGQSEVCEVTRLYNDYMAARTDLFSLDVTPYVK